MLAWVAAHQFMLTGVILMLVIGPAIGNYACSVVYRLPRGRTPFERHPFCGHCDADLKPIDLFPILSWCITRGRCRYCGGVIPAIYTWIELACAAAFIGYFLIWDVSEIFLLATSYAVFVIILASIQWQQGWLSVSIYSYAFLAIALLRSMLDGTIYNWLPAAFLVLIACLAWHRFISWVFRTPCKPFDTPWIWWLTLMAAVTGKYQLPLLIVPAAFIGVFRLLPARYRPLALVPITVLALYLPTVVFPAME